MPLKYSFISVEPPATGFGLELARALAAALRTGVQENWRELRSVEEQVDAITDDFDGEDVLHPRVRANINEAKTALNTLHGDVREYAGPFELPEPDDELRATIQRVVDNEVRHLALR